MKQLEYLARSVPGARLLGADVPIENLATDSRVQDLSGCLFICISGGRVDAHLFAGEVRQKGAAALVVEHPVDCDLPQLLVRDSREAWSYLASAFFDHPSRKLRLIGVTGTKGKTTTTTLVTRVLEHAGYRVGLMGTVMNYVAGTVYPQHLTTPDPMEMQEMFARMVQAGCDFAVMELSAHAAALRKVAGLEFEIVGFTNLSQDHLNDFKTMENYGAAKAKLFSDDLCRMAIVNADDPFTPTLLAQRKGPTMGFSLQSEAAIRATDISSGLAGICYDMHFGALREPMKLSLGGRFNVQNSLLAAAICAQAGVGLHCVAQGLSTVAGVDGRLERVEGCGELLVFVDYAHTPDSLENVLQTLRQDAAGRIWTVFGCGGDRDRLKRPLMGAIAERLSDHCVITTDNPRNEEPEAILEEIAAGLTDRDKAVILSDRTQAIHYALAHAAPGDTVLIAGKGHETYQEIRGVRHHFDDREVVRRFYGRE